MKKLCMILLATLPLSVSLSANDGGNHLLGLQTVKAESYSFYVKCPCPYEIGGDTGSYSYKMYRQYYVDSNRKSAYYSGYKYTR